MCLSFVLLKRQKSRLLYILFHLNGFQIYVLYFESALIAEFCPVVALYAEITREQKVGTSHFAPSCVNNDNMEIQLQIQIIKEVWLVRELRARHVRTVNDDI